MEELEGKRERQSCKVKGERWGYKGMVKGRMQRSKVKATGERRKGRDKCTERVKGKDKFKDEK